ncbi:hypothetical protein EBESD8_40980 [Rhodococcus aetherivorans]|nr:hypothetical protein EBESD8_40980 [Rhodococcus aetherivorans]
MGTAQSAHSEAGGGTIPVELSHGISGEVGIRDRREMRMVVGDMLERLVRRSPGKDALVGWAGAYATDDFRRLASGRGPCVDAARSGVAAGRRRGHGHDEAAPARDRDKYASVIDRLCCAVT